MKEPKNDAFDLWWEWAEKPLDSMLTIPANLHDAVMALSPEERRDRAKVNKAARTDSVLYAFSTRSCLVRRFKS